MKKCCGTCYLGKEVIDTSWFNWAHTKTRIRCDWPKVSIPLPLCLSKDIMLEDEGWNCPCWTDRLSNLSNRD